MAAEPRTASASERGAGRAFTDPMMAFAEAVRTMSDVATRGAAIMLIAVGPLMIGFALGLRYYDELTGVSRTDFPAAEFITTIVVGGVLIVAGGCLRLYHTRTLRAFADAEKKSADEARKDAVTYAP